jgi:hypothetical protein
MAHILALCRRQHGVDSSLNTAGIVSSTKLGDDYLSDNSLADGVGQRAFQSASRRDEKFVIVDEDEKDGPIVLFPGSRFPGIVGIRGVLGDLSVRRKTGVDGDEDLTRGIAFELLELIVNGRRGCRIDHTRLIGEITIGLGRKILSVEKEASPYEKEERQGRESPQ